MSSLQRLVGSVLGGRYRLERPIGEGGMGAIFEATQLSLSRRVAVKIVKPAFDHDEDRIKRFEVETEAIARLNHPHIVSVVDAGRSEDGTLFLAMELLDGKTLRQAMREGPFPWPRALTIAEGVASALVAAHDAGVIHRDLKAENVLLWSRAGRPDFAKVLDFGVAKLTSQVQAPAVTGTGFVAGTPGCISPEQILGKNDDPRSDLYSLGVLLFEMLTGRPPFLAKNPMELMLQHLHEPVPHPASLMPDLPAAVDALVFGLLQKDPALRPRHAQDLVDALRSMRESVGATVSEVMSPATTPPSVRAPGAAPPAPHGLLTPPPPGTSIGSKVFAVPPDAAPSPQAQAVPEQAAQTSPTTLHPLAAAGARRRRPVVLGAAALALGVLVFAGFRSSAYLSSVSSRDRAARAHIERAEDAYWELDTRRVMDETRLALKRDPDAAWAHVLRAQALHLEHGSLARADAEIVAAQRAAERRYRDSMMFQTTHLQHIVDVLATLDMDEAERRFATHPGEYRCDDALERQMFAVKLQAANHSPEDLERLYRNVRFEDSSELQPATVVGLARASRAAGDFEGARKLLTELKERSRSPLVWEELVDIELATGNVELARALLDEMGREKLRTFRSQLRQARLATDRTAYEPLLAELAGLPADDPARVDGLSAIAMQLAAQGRLREASERWQDALSGAVSDDCGAVDHAFLAVFFNVLHADFERGRQWNELGKERKDRCNNAITEARLKTFALAANFLLPRADDKKPSSKADFKALREAKRDIPLLLQQVEFSEALDGRHFEDAREATRKMPACIASTYRGFAERARALKAATPTDAASALRSAASEFDAATTPAQIAQCTAGVDIISFLQSVAVGVSFAQRALTAQSLDDRDAARAAIDGFRAYWPLADADLPSAREIASAEAWLTGTATATTTAPR